MIKRPSAYWHMIKWGFFSGTILAMLYMTFIFGLGSSVMDVILGLFSPFIWFFAMIWGGIPGIILGWLEAIFIKQQVKDIPDPFTKQDMRNKRLSVYGIAGIMPILVHLVLATLVFMGGEADAWLFYLFFFGIPALIASAGSIYAAHRYLFRLRLHGMQLADTGLKAKRGEKQKHDQALPRLAEQDNFLTLNDDEHQTSYRERRRH